MLEQTNLDATEAVQEFPHGRMAVGTVGEYSAWKLIAEPGWRFSQDNGPDLDVASCPGDHVLFIVSGRMGTRMDTGEELESRPGDVVRVSPGHDAWTIGDDSLVAVGVDPA